ncbi:MAG TPA: class I SAM-dependent methyltransferase [Pyrinomonadaceae bacterium]|nr:class I SAM-dependent methyltransferase [Pyrinomonadaceae bacterium]
MKNNKKTLPAGFEELIENLPQTVENVEGFLTPHEMRFLALLAAYPTAKGEVLEIGSFKGKSTVILAKAAALTGNGRINAVDPMTAPSETDPDLRGDESSFPDFQKNLEKHGVTNTVEFNRTFSFELAKTWNKPIRFLWIDGDHTYKGTKLDFDGFAPHLSDGAIVAIHDVLHAFEGGVRVVMEDILLSRNFGACGFVGSIAWAQFHQNERDALPFRTQKLKLYERLSRLIPYVVFRDGELTGLEKKMYKFYRSRIPHGAIKPEKWLEMVVRKD